MKAEHFDIAVVGSGHAGIEAGLAAARMGCKTVIVTQNLDTIGQMSCNPAIGGPAKSHLAAEIDALGGAMAYNADATGIQFRILNRSKGPAVWATRIQCDKRGYQARMKLLLEQTENLTILQATARAVMVRGDEVCGLDLDLGIAVETNNVIVTAGTFLQALLHVGTEKKAGGRMGDTVSNLSDSLRSLGLKSDRFKTGTPCRINARSVDYSLVEEQPGLEPAPRLSDAEWDEARPVSGWNFRNGTFHVEQLPCWITGTTPATSAVIRQNLHRSPLYSGQIEGTGPRYCPSIEDKVVRFPDRETHSIFLEPEGRRSNEMYVNGVSTSLPFDVQVEFIRSIRGLESAEIIRPGYAVEYDFFPPTQLSHTLETKKVAGLYLAGQVNGTSGYEEAAAQGLVAGTHGACRALNKNSISFSSSNSYIGVMIEDLTSRGTDEPYRMFTSRALNRLQFRQDNADERLTPLGIELGLISKAQNLAYQNRSADLRNLRDFAESVSVAGKPLTKAMRSPEFNLSSIPHEYLRKAHSSRWERLMFDLRYEGYVARQRTSSLGNRAIPDSVDFSAIPSLRAETRQKLSRFRPPSMAQARRIPGLTEADLSILDIWLAKRSFTP